MLEEIQDATAGLSAAQLWESVRGAASVGFHMRHLAGSTSRLLTYARGEPLTEVQRARLASEKARAVELSAADLMRDLRDVVQECLSELRRLDDSQLDVPRPVGRAGNVSTVRGILHHAGEHAARHSGQVVTTARIARG